jgi:geranylgeranyl reductase family protein
MCSSLRFDVAIVGAGPAGARAAWRLARDGARVAIVDGSHPREKPCGGGLTGRALDLVRDAVAPSTLAAVGIRDADFEDGSRRVTIPLSTRAPEPPLLTVAARQVFDGALLAAALDAGAHFMPERVSRIARDAQGWTIASRERSIAADWLLGADGPNSFVRRQVLAPFGREDLSIATGFYVHGCTSATMAIRFEHNPAGYLWSFPRPDHLAIGVCAQADRSSPASLLPLVSRWIERHTPGGARLEKYSWPIPSLTIGAIRREQPAGPRWMLLGDAGGMVDPITREGIYFALASGDAAGRSLAAGRDAAREYEQRIRDTVHAELTRAAALKAMFFKPRFTGLLVDALGASASIRDVMADLIGGVQPYHGLRRRLLGTLELRLFARLVATRLFGA